MKRLVLAGAGHTHALVLLQMARRRWPGVEVLLLSPEPWAPYSGMVPGWLAGQYRLDEIVVDVPALAAAAGARWLAGSLQALDPDAGRIELADGSALDLDLLSLDVGSTLVPPPSRHATLLPLRPLALLQHRVQALLAAWADPAAHASWTVAAVGGGAAGVEGLLALLRRLRTLRPERGLQAALHTQGETVLPGFAVAAQQAALRALARAGVQVHTGSTWSEALDAASDVVVWATGAQAHAWQQDPARRGALAVDAQGFVRINAQLRSVSHAQVFAAGDCCSWPGQPLPKAGVHAVRMAPVLAQNLRLALGLAGGALAAAPATHRPQRRTLALLSTADGRAIATRGAWTAEGAWAWRWKEWIDRRFIARFRRAPRG